MYEEEMRCADCGCDKFDWEDAEHCRCKNCACPVTEHVAVAYATGDGSMAKLMANGQCPKCRCEMAGQMKCENCGLEIVNETR